MQRRVVVVGSGAAGLSAAIAAATAGAHVTLLERATHLGGTTAISGGVAWIPASDQARAAGVDDSPAAALEHLRALGRGDYDDDLASTYVQEAAGVARDLEARTPLRWSLLPDWPDYRCELPGGRDGGRSIWPEPVAAPPEVARLIQRSPEIRGPVPQADTDGRVTDAVVLRGPVRGQALVAAMLTGALDLGVQVHTGIRVTSLVTGAHGDVRGVRVDGIGLDGDEEIPGQVVLTTGGFQHDAAFVRSFLPAPGIVPLGPPGCAGDGLRMVLAAGAALANMTEGWWMPAMHVPGEELDGSPFWRPLHHERAQPGALMVDRHGRRFVDEAQNYCDAGRAMLRFDASSFSWPAAPAWLVFDRAYRARTPIGPLTPDDPDPPWLHVADDLSALADRIAVPPAALEQTVATFNEHARRGCDPEFGRGVTHYDRWIGDHRAPHPTLAPLEEPPFHALAVHPGCMGTKGGPRTDTEGRVRRVDGSVVPGLFAAGNAAASPFGIGTPGGGATIGPALVFGARAGAAAAATAATAAEAT